MYFYGFCIDADFKIKESDLYQSFSQDKGRAELKAKLKTMGFKGVRPHFVVLVLRIRLEAGG